MNLSRAVKDPKSVRPKRFRRFKLLETDTPLLELLTKEHREILLRGDGRCKDIGMELNISHNTVKTRRHRARVALTALREKQGA